MAKPAPPLWRRAFDQGERVVGRPLEQAVQTRAFADAVALSVRIQRSLGRAYERNTRTVLHLCNLPARTDVQRLNRQVGDLRNEIREISVRVGEHER